MKSEIELNKAALNQKSQDDAKIIDAIQGLLNLNIYDDDFSESNEVIEPKQDKSSDGIDHFRPMGSISDGEYQSTKSVSDRSLKPIGL